MRMAKAKTDKKDAQMIAHYAESECPELWQPDQEHVTRLQQINTALEGLHKQVSIAINQLEAFSHVPGKDPEVIKVLRSLLRILKTKIAKLETRMLEIAEKHYKKTYDALTSIPMYWNENGYHVNSNNRQFQKISIKQKAVSICRTCTTDLRIRDKCKR